MSNVVMDVITYPENLSTTSGLSILMHGVISLPDVTSYDKILYTGVHKVSKYRQPICHILV